MRRSTPSAPCGSSGTNDARRPQQPSRQAQPRSHPWPRPRARPSRRPNSRRQSSRRPNSRRPNSRARREPRGHRNISGRTCTRERGHAAKSHRYSSRLPVDARLPSRDRRRQRRPTRNLSTTGLDALPAASVATRRTRRLPDVQPPLRSLAVERLRAAARRRATSAWCRPPPPPVRPAPLHDPDQTAGLGAGHLQPRSVAGRQQVRSQPSPRQHRRGPVTDRSYRRDGRDRHGAGERRGVAAAVGRRDADVVGAGRRTHDSPTRPSRSRRHRSSTLTQTGPHRSVAAADMASADTGGAGGRDRRGQRGALTSSTWARTWLVARPPPGRRRRRG